MSQPVVVFGAVRPLIWESTPSSVSVQRSPSVLPGPAATLTECVVCARPGLVVLDGDAPYVVHVATWDGEVTSWRCALPPRDIRHPESQPSGWARAGRKRPIPAC